MTTTALATRTSGELATALDATARQARETLERSRADETRRVYRLGWRDFAAYCEMNGLEAMPADPGAVVLFLNHLAFERNLSVSSLNQRLAAIRLEHHRAGEQSPTLAPIVAETMKGIRRTLAQSGRLPQGKRALQLPELERMIEAQPGSEIGIRNRAILAVGFMGAFRRSELAALELSDVTFDENGATVLVRRSKSDQEGKGRYKALPLRPGRSYCPVRALRAWLKVRGRRKGPLFYSFTPQGEATGDGLLGADIRCVVDRCARIAGVDRHNLSTHSLRVGFVTTARRLGASSSEIMNQTHHQSSAMIDHYTRASSVWDANAATRI